VLDVGMVGQARAGRQLALADFTALGLSAPLGLWNLSDLTDASGNARALLNKGAVPFGVGINGQASTAAVFAGSTAQALYIADTGAADPFRIRTGSWGCWFRTAKRATGQVLVSKFNVTNQYVWTLYVNSATNTLQVDYSTAGTALAGPTGSTDVADDRWHFGVATHDGAILRLYVDGVLEGPVRPTLAGDDGAGFMGQQKAGRQVHTRTAGGVHGGATRRPHARRRILPLRLLEARGAPLVAHLLRVRSRRLLRHLYGRSEARERDGGARSVADGYPRGY